MHMHFVTSCHLQICARVISRAHLHTNLHHGRTSSCRNQQPTTGILRHRHPHPPSSRCSLRSSRAQPCHHVPRSGFGTLHTWRSECYARIFPGSFGAQTFERPALPSEFRSVMAHPPGGSLVFPGASINQQSCNRRVAELRGYPKSFIKCSRSKQAMSALPFRDAMVSSRFWHAGPAWHLLPKAAEPSQHNGVRT